MLLTKTVAARTFGTLLTLGLTLTACSHASDPGASTMAASKIDFSQPVSIWPACGGYVVTVQDTPDAFTISRVSHGGPSATTATIDKKDGGKMTVAKRDDVGTATTTIATADKDQYNKQLKFFESELNPTSVCPPWTETVAAATALLKSYYVN